MENGHKSYAKACEVEPLRRLAEELTALVNQSESTIRMSYQYLYSVVDKAMQRADGKTNKLMTFSE